jgi:hypothetical protein
LDLLQFTGQCARHEAVPHQVVRQQRADGSLLWHLQRVESVWNPAKRRSETKVVYSCGRADDPAVAERLRRLAKNILRCCSPDEIVAEDPSWKRVDAWPCGDLYVLEQLWQRLGLAEILEAAAQGRTFEFSVERALFTLVANRALGPCSKLYPAPRKRGYSKNGRGDVPEIVVGLAVTREGIPVRHWVFPGNTVAVSTVAQV